MTANMTAKLYTMPGTCALAPNIAVAWLDAPVEVVAMAYGDHKKDSYLAINPKGKVPALQFEDGDVLTEAAAILSWLGAAYGSELYARDTKLGRKEAELLSFLTSEVHAAFGPHFAADAFADSKEAQEEVKAHAYDTIAGHLAYLEDGMSGDYLLDKRSFADAYLYVVLRWVGKTPIDMSAYPKLAGLRDRLDADAGVRTALARQNMEPLGA